MDIRMRTTGGGPHLEVRHVRHTLPPAFQVSIRLPEILNRFPGAGPLGKLQCRILMLQAKARLDIVALA
jgi:hypothetical protein